MELVKKIKKLICFHSERNIKPDFLDTEVLTLENTFDTLTHYPKESLAFALLQLQKLILILDPNDSYDYSDKEFKNIDQKKVLSEAIYLIENVHSRTNEITPKEVH
tara:strand:- start:178 stop:495 length:318 start_codon:yes stop_codon:yes gene_type:complete